MKTEAQNQNTTSSLITRPLQISLQVKNCLVVICAFFVASVIWVSPVEAPLNERGMHFFATLFAAVALWMLDLLDDYVVGLILLLAWVVLGIVPANVALAGFAENSWFFIIGSFGIASAISKTSLLRRLAFKLLRWIPIHWQKTHTAVLLIIGALSALVLPSGKARASVAMPISRAIAETAGFVPRSSGSAVIALAAFVGFTQMQFLFLTGAEQNLMIWNLLSPSQKSEFGWFAWCLTGLPSAVVILGFMFWSMRMLLPLSPEEKHALPLKAVERQLTDPGPVSPKEGLAFMTLVITVVGWLTVSYHGVKEAWVALAALLVFLCAGILDKRSFASDLDWGLILYFGVLNSLSVVTDFLKINAWFLATSGPILKQFIGRPLEFLMVLFLLIVVVRFVLHKTPTTLLFTVTLLPLSSEVGIHPGVLLVTVVMAAECFIFGYQDGPYQIAYGGTGGSPFSHGQARKILAAKYLATVLAIAVSVPYWQFLGLIR